MIDAIAVDTKVEHLDIAGERTLELRPPRVLVRHFHAERERIADERDTMAWSTCGEADVGPRASETFGAAEVEFAATLPVHSGGPAEKLVGDEVGAMERGMSENLAILRGHLGPVAGEQRCTKDRQALRSSQTARAEGSIPLLVYLPSRWRFQGANSLPEESPTPATDGRPPIRRHNSGR